ncbi:MAG: hypothetical protein ACLUE8_02545 [Lachnospiraceae bacterium]
MGVWTAFSAWKEVSRFSKGIFSWVGYRTKWLEYENVERVAGETKWNFWKLYPYSIDGITAFSNPRAAGGATVHYRRGLLRGVHSAAVVLLH